MTLEGDLEGTSPGHLGESWGAIFAVGDEVAVEVVGEVSFGNLVAHGDGVGDAFNDCLGDYRYVVLVSWETYLC
jgi:hypothetical protein